VFPIGRLDKDSEGLILLTNDGDIVNEILRVEHHHEKEYVVAVDRAITPEFVDGMVAGVRLSDANNRPCNVEKLGAKVFRIILTQGLNRQIRRMCEAFGFAVTALQRVRIMRIHLGELPLGRWRNLTNAELATILPSRNAAPQEAPAQRAPGARTASGPRGAPGVRTASGPRGAPGARTASGPRGAPGGGTASGPRGAPGARTASGPRAETRAPRDARPSSHAPRPSQKRSSGRGRGSW